MNESTIPATREDSTPRTGCDCFTLTNEALKEHNTELDAMWLFQKDGSILTTIEIGTSLCEKKRGARPKRIVPTFCPFCGNRYAPDAAAAVPGAGDGGTR